MMNRIKTTDIISQQFYQLPKAFYNKESKYFSLSNNAKVLYALLKDRLSLSIKNNWHNDKNEVYLIMTRQEISELLCVCENIARKAIKELIEVNLIEDERQGLNKPNYIYLNNLDVENLINTGPSKNEGQDPQKMSGNNTDINKTKIKSLLDANVTFFLDYFSFLSGTQINKIEQRYIDILKDYIDCYNLTWIEIKQIINYYINQHNAKDKTINLLLTERVFLFILSKLGIISPEEAFDETGNYNF